MIHLHGFLSETNTSTSGQNSGAALNQSKLDDFHGALSDAVSSTLEKFGISSDDVKISITRANAVSSPPATSASNTTDRTTPPTPGTPAASSSGASASAGSSTSTTSASDSTTGPPDGGYDPFLQAAYSNPFASVPAQSSSSSSTQASAAPVSAQQAFDNAYWAAQPAPVQALRTMTNQEDRATLATQLASEGYSIDVPIMVWGWDPSTTMSMREADGYTWVPSALQTPVQDAPGLPSMGTLAAYDPNSPPAGSIAVS